MAKPTRDWSRQLSLSVQEDLLTKLQKLGTQIMTQVSLTEITEGNIRFKRFKENGHKWLQEDYQHEGFQAVFCDRLFMIRAELIFSILSGFESQEELQLPNLLYDTTFQPRALTVASFGCGPGNDLAGFEAYFTHQKKRNKMSLDERKASNFVSQTEYSQTLKCIEEAKIESIVGYDSAEGWGRYLNVLDYTFIHQVVDSGFINEMPPVDIVILSYFAHNALFSSPISIELTNYNTVEQQQLHVPTHAYDYLRNWDILKRKTKMIVVIDTKACDEPLFHLLQARGFVSVVGETDTRGREVAAHIWTDKDSWN